MASAGMSKIELRRKFDEIFCELLPRLYRRAVAVSGSPEAAEDALHDAYLKLAAHPQRMLDHPEPYAYAFAAVVNLVRDEWRKRKRQATPADPRQLLADSHTNSWDGGIRLREAEMETMRMLTRLSTKQAAVVLLVDVDGFTIDQTARALGLHRGTVSRTRARALRKLRDLLTEPVTRSGGAPR
jgi:RNA polymerase sigma-70 factor (ECF subfamily)